YGLVLIENERAIFAIGISTAFISGLLAVRFLLRYLAGHTLNIFAYYRISIGLLVLIASLV
ncbi:undecaprenyl-diphosphatase, partial [Candidatus Saccharibacteria bacterium]|nr:undecaprenyl-diphosphatase [Candidatus Saccharibacteria bacterium]